MTDHDIGERFQQLIDQLDRSELQDDVYGAQNYADRGPMLGVCAAAHALVFQLSPGDSSFLPQLVTMMADLQTRGMTKPSMCRVMLTTMKEHFSGGFHRIRELVEAAIFDDILDMAKYLLGEGHHLPAAALAGAVLEDSLRKLCAKHNVTWTCPSSISKLNTALYKANQEGLLDDYNNTTQKQVTAWCGLRNDVDHGNFADPGKIDRGEVKRMVEGVRDFIVKYLT